MFKLNNKDIGKVSITSFYFFIIVDFEQVNGLFFWGYFLLNSVKFYNSTHHGTLQLGRPITRIKNKLSK